MYWLITYSRTPFRSAEIVGNDVCGCSLSIWLKHLKKQYPDDYIVITNAVKIDHFDYTEFKEIL